MATCLEKNIGKRRELALVCAASLFCAPDAHGYNRGGPPAGNRAAQGPVVRAGLLKNMCSRLFARSYPSVKIMLKLKGFRF